MRFRKFFFATTLFTLITLPVLAEPHGWGDRGGRHNSRHNDDWDERRDRGHHYGRHYDRHYDRHYGNDRRNEGRTNFQIFFGQSFGNRHGYGYGPHYRPARRIYPDHYHSKHNTILLGVLFGGPIGRSMTPYDYGYAANVFEVTPSRQTVAWQNPDYGTSYQVTPIRTYQLDNGQYCREYQAVVLIGGRQENSFGTACRSADGAWQIMH